MPPLLWLTRTSRLFLLVLLPLVATTGCLEIDISDFLDTGPPTDGGMDARETGEETTDAARRDVDAGADVTVAGDEPVGRLINRLTEYVRATDWSDSKAVEAQLAGLVRAIRVRYEGDKICGTLDELQTLMKVVGEARKAGQVVRGTEHIQALVRQIIAELLKNVEWRRECKADVDPTRETTVAITRDTLKGLEGTVSFGAPTFTSRIEEGNLYTELGVAGIDAHTQPVGAPGIPTWRGLIAVPLDAEVVVRSVQAVPAETTHVELFPAQPGTVDAENVERVETDDARFALAPYVREEFVRDEGRYGSEEPFPDDESICTVRRMGAARDLELAAVECAAGQYVGATDELVLFEKVGFEVEFRGGRGAFLPEVVDNAFVRQLIPMTVLLNTVHLFDTFAKPLPTSVVGGTDAGGACAEDFKGTAEEFLILTHPRFVSEADRLARYKRRRGIMTRVQVVRDGPYGAGPDDSDAIKSYLVERYATCGRGLRYVLLLGDSDFIPPRAFRGPRGATLKKKGKKFDGGAKGDGKKKKEDQAVIATDLHYARIGPDWIPDLVVGRLPVRTLEQAERVVDRIQQHETSPPTDDGWFENVTLGALFECCEYTEYESDEKVTVEPMNSRLVTSGPAILDGSMIPAGYPVWVDVDFEGGPTIEVSVEGGQGSSPMLTDGNGDSVSTTITEEQDFLFEQPKEGTVHVTVENKSGSAVDVDIAIRWGKLPVEVPEGQDTKTYLPAAEYVRKKLEAAGIGVETVYNQKDPWTYPGDKTVEYHADGTPVANWLKTGNYDWRPADMMPMDEHAAELKTPQLRTAFEEGRFVIAHRDHGTSQGWMWPRIYHRKQYLAGSSFDYAYWGRALDGLNNTSKLPILFGVNCNSGDFAQEFEYRYMDDPTTRDFKCANHVEGWRWDGSACAPVVGCGCRGSGCDDLRETEVACQKECVGGMCDSQAAEGYTRFEYFTEHLLRGPDVGASGAIAAVMLTDTGLNNRLLKGLFDGIWPSTLSGYGTTVPDEGPTPRFGTDGRPLRLGDVYHHAAFYAYVNAGLSPGGDVVPNKQTAQLAYYHILADPTLTVMTGAPTAVPTTYTPKIEGQVLLVGYSKDGATIVAYQWIDGELVPVGQGVVVGGEATIEPNAAFDPNREIYYSAALSDGSSAALSAASAVEPLQSDSSFSTPTKIDFEGLSESDELEAQFQAQGVTFLTVQEDKQRLEVVRSNSVEQRRADSGHLLIRNRYVGTPGEARPAHDGFPVVIRFSSKVTAVGLKVGIKDVRQDFVVVMKAYDEDGRLLGVAAQHRNDAKLDFGYDFLGVRAGSAEIAEIRIHGEAGAGGEHFDTLLFE